MGRSDAPKNPTPAAGRPATFDRVVRYMAEAWIGVAGAAAMFAAFVAYAYLAPATYRTTAQLILQPASKDAKLPNADELARSVERAALDDATVRSLAAEAAGPGGDKAATARRIRNAFELDTADGRTFNLTFSDGSAERTQSVVNRLARQAANQIPELLAATAPRPVDERRKRTAELGTFLAEHPELADAPLAPEEKAPDEASDPVSAALRAERKQLETELAARKKAGSDNPYDDPAALELAGDKLQRRLNEINTALAARSKALKRAPSPAPRLAPEVEAEWRRLLQAVAQAKSPPAPATPAPVVTARVVEATLPNTPISPDRRAVLLLGALVTLGTGISLGLGATALSRARPKKRPGPATIGNAPAAPRVQTALGQTARVVEPVKAMQAAPAHLALPPAGASQPPAGESQPPAAALPPAGAAQTPAAAPAPGGQATFLSTMPSRDAEPSRTEPPRVEVVASASAEPRPNLGGAIQPSPVKTLQQSSVQAEPQVERSRSEPKRTAVGLGVPAELLQGAAAAAATAQPTNATPPAPAARSAGSDPPRPVVEINATAHQHAGAEVNDPEAAPEPAPQTERLEGRAAPARRTQMLGSPIPPVMPASKRGGPPPDYAANRHRSPAQGTYSYVSSAPPEPAQNHHQPRAAYPEEHRRREEPRYAEPRHVDARPVDPRHADPRYQEPPKPGGREADGYLSTPPPGAPLAGRIVVTPYPPPAGWSPSRSLSPAARRPLRDAIYPHAVGGCSVIGVSGIQSADHRKSNVACELALALAESRHPRVLLLEADFHWPNVHRLMRVEMPLSTGFSQQLRGRSHGPASDHWSVVECSPTLHVLGEGVMRSPGLILTTQFEEALRALRTYYDFIVIDGPSSEAEVDCQALASVIDGVVLVGYREETPEFHRAVRPFMQKRFAMGVPE
jgi:Mrp family chromosome partitioning ATPase